jgi:1-acyl-sn-glycerol-3-phosphate acyltransferase
MLRTGSIISNHSAFLDPVVLAMFTLPCHVTKSELAVIPVVGKICKINQCMFLDRTNKDSKKDMQKQITDR